jgi:hypothetical protein
VRLIEQYWQELVPLIVYLTLLKHQLNRHPVPDWVPACPYELRGAKRCVGTPAGLSPSLSRGVYAAKSGVGPDLVAGWSVRATHWHAARSAPAVTPVFRSMDLLKG